MILAKEVEPVVARLFNTAIREVDYEVARALGLEDVVEIVRALVVSMARRRLPRAGEAKLGALKGTEPAVAPKPARSRRSEKHSSKLQGSTSGLSPSNARHSITL